MRPEPRKPSRRRGSTAPPPRRAARARRRSSGRSTRTLDQLRRGREAVTDIVGQLDSLLAQLRTGPIDTAAPERLAGAARQANRAFTALAQLRGLLP
jgi:hypothetical protein